MLAIAYPIQIGCTTCHQAMRVEYQELIETTDDLLVAAECACGRKIGCVTFFVLRSGRPLIVTDIADCGDIGAHGKEMVGRGRERIERGERRIAAATWARGGK